jgi:hypothetical protein
MTLPTPAPPGARGWRPPGRTLAPTMSDQPAVTSDRDAPIAAASPLALAGARSSGRGHDDDRAAGVAEMRIGGSPGE